MIAPSTSQSYYALQYEDSSLSPEQLYPIPQESDEAFMSRYIDLDQCSDESSTNESQPDALYGTGHASAIELGRPSLAGHLLKLAPLSTQVDLVLAFPPAELVPQSDVVLLPDTTPNLSTDPYAEASDVKSHPPRALGQPPHIPNTDMFSIPRCSSSLSNASVSSFYSSTSLSSASSTYTTATSSASASSSPSSSLWDSQSCASSPSPRSSAPKRSTTSTRSASSRPRRPRKNPSPRNIQMPRLTNPHDWMNKATLTCLVPGCKNPRVGRLPDLKRHVDTHFPVKFACVGVPIEEAVQHGLAIPDFDSQPFILKGRTMVGGCWKSFSRKDAYMRWHNSRGCTCVGKGNRVSAWQLNADELQLLDAHKVTTNLKVRQ